MATLAVDKPRSFELGEINELPVIAADIIYEGAAVGDNGVGYMRPLVAGDPFKGFAERKVDNSAGLAGDKNVRLRTEGLVVADVTGVTGVGDHGKLVYASDDDTFTLTAGANTVIGNVYRWISGTTCVVYFEVDNSFVAAGAITRTKMTSAGASKDILAESATIATTGNTDCYVIVPETGVLSGIDFSGVDALAAHDTNYITFSVTNLGQAGAGSTAMLAATAANTTKVTGGSALSANAKRSLTLHGTAGNLNVTAGDRLLIRAAASGTLANTVTFPTYMCRFGGTT